MDWLLQNINAILSWIVALLPDSPFTGIDSTPIQNIMQYINWVVPVDRILQLTAAWIACVAVYYLYAIILRWAKAL